MNTGIKFTWERGSLNSSAIKALDKKALAGSLIYSGLQST